MIDKKVDPPTMIEVEIGGNVMVVSEFIVDDGIKNVQCRGHSNTGIGSTKII